MISIQIQQGFFRFSSYLIYSNFRVAVNWMEIQFKIQLKHPCFIQNKFTIRISLSNLILFEKRSIHSKLHFVRIFACIALLTKRVAHMKACNTAGSIAEYSSMCFQRHITYAYSDISYVYYIRSC